MAIPTTFEQLEAAQGQVTTLSAANEKLTADLTAALKSATDAESRAKSAEDALVKANDDLTTANASLADAKAANEKLTAENATLSAAEKDVEKRASARLAAMQAGLGISPPLPVGASTSAPGKQDPLAGLTGLARATAAHKLATSK